MPYPMALIVNIRQSRCINMAVFRRRRQLEVKLTESHTRVVLQCGSAVRGFDLISCRGLFDAENGVWFAAGWLFINEIFVFFVWCHLVADVV